MTRSRRSSRAPARHSSNAAAPPAPPASWRRHGVTLAAFAVLFVTLELVSYTRESATYDEPFHLTDGYFSLALRDHRVDPEHPPLLRMWAALPLLGLSSVRADQETVNAADPVEWAFSGLFLYAHQFMYEDNDADLMLYRARMMVVLLGLVLGGLIYWWAHDWFGWAGAAASLALYALEPNLLAHARLVTTDFGITCFIFGAVFFLWRTVTRWHVGNVAALAAFVALAVTSKFSGLILAPILGVLFVIAVSTGRLSARRALTLVVLLGATSIAAIWAIYGFRYLPSESAQWQYAFHTDAYALERVPTLARVVGWVDDHRLLPNMYSQGFLLGQARAQLRHAFLAGSYSTAGWWYFFPVAIALKTPLTLLLVGALGAMGWLRRDLRRPGTAFVVVPIVVYLGWSMTMAINIGVRHVLPIYPFVILVAGAALHRWLGDGRTYVVAAVIALCTLELGTAYPHTLAFFNVLAGGPSGGIAYLVDSNLDWGQDLKPLKAWMDEHHVEDINLAYFGHADPHYYGIRATFLPGAPGWSDPELRQPPRLPGYVAVSATFLQGVYAETEAQRQYYKGLLAHRPVAIIGHSIYVYRLDQKW